MTAEVIELLKLSLGLYFSLAKMNNATKEELETLYQEEKNKFIINSPDILEDV